MDFYWVVALASSIYIAGTIAIFRYSNINTIYHPFIYYVWLGCLNEMFGFTIIMNGYKSTASNNVYAFFAALFLIWFFKKLNVIKKEWIFYLLIALIILAWITENFIYGSITVNSTYFRIFVATIVVVMSTIVINRLIFKSKNLLKNPTFLICLAFIIFFTYRILVQAFVGYGYDSLSFLTAVYTIMYFINFCSNLIYALAILWMPQKENFTQGLSLQ